MYSSSSELFVPINHEVYVLYKHIQRANLPAFVSTGRKRKKRNVLTYQAQSEDHARPEKHIIQGLPTPNPPRSLHHKDGQLHHLADKPISSDLLSDARHDNFVAHRRHQECDDGGARFADMRPRGRVHVSTQEGVHGNVPLARELHPVGRVPPVAIEVTVGETSDLGKGTEDVFKDDEEDKEEGQHEGEEEPADALSQDEERLRGGRWGRAGRV